MGQSWGGVGSGLVKPNPILPCWLRLLHGLSRCACGRQSCAGYACQAPALQGWDKIRGYGNGCLTLSPTVAGVGLDCRQSRTDHPVFFRQPNTFYMAPVCLRRSRTGTYRLCWASSMGCSSCSRSWRPCCSCWSAPAAAASACCSSGYGLCRSCSRGPVSAGSLLSAACRAPFRRCLCLRTTFA